MTVDLLFTNDWELFGDGSGDFSDLQERPLKEMLAVFAKHSGKFTLFAEIGQHWAHRELGSRLAWAKELSDRWEALVRLTIQSGHDVQLHLHPTWLGAKRVENEWQLNFKNWKLETLGASEIENILKRGRETLETVACAVDRDYRCVAFRAGAFCIQPESITVPALVRAGIQCDSSVVSGMTDHLFFDFTKAHERPGAYMAQRTNLTQEATNSEGGLLELPIHTQKIWDSPLLRRLLPKHYVERLQYGVLRDVEFERWAYARDQRTRDIYPSARHPLTGERRRVLRGFARWPGMILRKSVIPLDYDFLAPSVFTAMVEKAVERAAVARDRAKRADRVASGDPLTLVALGHAKNMQSAENLDRILEQLRARLGSALTFKTVRRSIQQYLGVREL